jgi:hypothetical protein
MPYYSSILNYAILVKSYREEIYTKYIEDITIFNNLTKQKKKLYLIARENKERNDIFLFIINII